MPVIALSALLLIIGIGVGYLIFRVQSRKQSILQPEFLYRTIVETGQDGIWMLDTDSRITFANPSLLKLLGYRQQDLIGRPASDFYGRRAQALCRTSLHIGSRMASASALIAAASQDGSPRWVCVSATPNTTRHINSPACLGICSR